MFSKAQTEKQKRPHTACKVGDYLFKTQDTLGQGNYSTVFKGRLHSAKARKIDRGINQPVAIKKIKIQTLTDQINQKLLQSQLITLQMIKGSKNILGVKQVIKHQDDTYIVTEICKSDLQKKILQKIDERDAQKYIKQLITGFQSLYQKNIVHRDLKPSNLLLDKHNKIKIGDFGFAIKAQDARKQASYSIGSPLYMAPQTLTKNQYSHKTDIWAIGIIIFEMYTGRTPWKAKNQQELLKAIENKKIEEVLKRQRVYIPPRVKQLIIKALDTDKYQRIQPEELIAYQVSQKKIKQKVPRQSIPNSIQRNASKSIAPQKNKENSIFASENFNVLNIDENKINHANYAKTSRKTIGAKIKEDLHVNNNPKPKTKRQRPNSSYKSYQNSTKAFNDYLQIKQMKGQQKSIMKNQQKVIKVQKQIKTAKIPKKENHERIKQIIKKKQQVSEKKQKIDNKQSQKKQKAEVKQKIEIQVQVEPIQLKILQNGLEVQPHTTQKSNEKQKKSTGKKSQYSSQKSQKIKKSQSTQQTPQTQQSPIKPQKISTQQDQNSNPNNKFTYITSSLTNHILAQRLLFKTIQYLHSSSILFQLCNSGLKNQNERLQKCYLNIMCKNINKVRDVSKNNFLKIKPEQLKSYTQTPEYKKITKLSNDDFNKYSKSQCLKDIWNQAHDPNYQFTLNAINSFMGKIYTLAFGKQKKQQSQQKLQKQFIILFEYLLLARKIVTGYKKGDMTSVEQQVIRKLLKFTEQEFIQKSQETQLLEKVRLACGINQ